MLCWAVFVIAGLSHRALFVFVQALRWWLFALKPVLLLQFLMRLFLFRLALIFQYE
jgi:hypothetical protein